MRGKPGIILETIKPFLHTYDLKYVTYSVVGHGIKTVGLENQIAKNTQYVQNITVHYVKGRICSKICEEENVSN